MDGVEPSSLSGLSLVKSCIQFEPSGLKVQC